MSLARLSLQRVTGYRLPLTHSNEERMQAYRARLPVQFANHTLAERIRAAAYQRAAIADAAPSTDDMENDL